MSSGMWEGLPVRLISSKQLKPRLFVVEQIILPVIKWEEETAFRFQVTMWFVVRLTANPQVSATSAWQQKLGWSSPA